MNMGGKRVNRRQRVLWSVISIGVGSLLAVASPTPSGGEYPLTSQLPGDQVHCRLVLGQTHSYVVWEDNAIDAKGQGIGVQVLNHYLAPIPSQLFRVNETTQGDQQNPDAALLPDGGIAIVWESGDGLDRDIYLRILQPNGLFLGPETRVNQYTPGLQTTPKIARLQNGNLVIVWSSLGQDGSLQGVYGRLFDPEGLPLTDEFPVNVFTSYNQRNPAVAALKDGTFVTVWVSENQSFPYSVDVVARRFSPDGQPLIGEVRVNATTNICANPTILATPQGPFFIAWSERGINDPTNRWDVALRGYQLDGTPLQEQEEIVNQFRLGDQYAPQLAASAGILMVVWTSLGQDNSWEEIYGRFLNLEGKPLGDEFRINQTFISRQIFPAVAAIGEKGFLAAWSSFEGGPRSFEILAQQYTFEENLPKPETPTLIPLDSRTLLASWARAGGQEGVTYLVYIDGAETPLATTNLYWKLTNLIPGSSHMVKIAYKLADGRISPVSDAATAQTWGWDDNFDGLPDDWQRQYWGPNPSDWPEASEDSDGDGASNRAEFLAGTDPIDSESILRIRLVPGPFGLVLEWDAIPGSLYRVEASSDLHTWKEVVGPMLAPSSTMSVVIQPKDQLGYYRVTRIR